MSDNNNEQGPGIEAGFSCPRESTTQEVITLGHGGGGKLTRELVEKLLLPAFDTGSGIARNLDSAVLQLGKEQANERLAFTTDSYVVKPIFFPGGDIGKLAISGTVNDLSMVGATPRYISLGLIIEEGFSQAELASIIESAASTAKAAGVEVVTGDTKVVERHHADGIFINTSGVGVLDHKLDISPDSIAEGDSIIVSGDIGRHGVAIMAARSDLDFSVELTSDVACLNSLVSELLSEDVSIRCMRDMTRGGLGSALLEIADDCNREFVLQEKDIPVAEQVASACSLLGMDPMYVANEGRFVMFVPGTEEHRVLDIIHKHPLGTGAAVIGKVASTGKAKVSIETAYGTRRSLQAISGEQLPRIC